MGESNPCPTLGQRRVALSNCVESAWLWRWRKYAAGWMHDNVRQWCSAHVLRVVRRTGPRDMNELIWRKETSPIIHRLLSGQFFLLGAERRMRTFVVATVTLATACQQLHHMLDLSAEFKLIELLSRVQFTSMTHLRPDLIGVYRQFITSFLTVSSLCTV